MTISDVRKSLDNLAKSFIDDSDTSTKQKLAEKFYLELLIYAETLMLNYKIDLQDEDDVSANPFQ